MKATMKNRVRVTLTINGTDYRCKPLPPHFGETKAFRLAKQAGKGEVYDVEQGLGGIRCTCPDYARRHAHLEGQSACKHGRALKAAGLLD